MKTQYTNKVSQNNLVRTPKEIGKLVGRLFEGMIHRRKERSRKRMCKMIFRRRG